MGAVTDLTQSSSARVSARSPTEETLKYIAKYQESLRLFLGHRRIALCT